MPLSLARLLVFLSLLPVLFTFSAGNPSLPFPRMEKARLLLSKWEVWERQNFSTDPPVDRRVEGAPCSVPLDDTRRLMYYRRFRVTLRKATDAGRDLRVRSHIAQRLAFYAQKLGAPPENHEARAFCRSPQDDFTLDEDPFGLLWPPTPMFLVCYARKCHPCSKAVHTELKEACDLEKNTPPEERIEGPSEAQRLLERLKTLQKFPSEEEREETEVGVEGGECSATPLETLAYASLLKTMDAPLSDPQTLAEYSAEWTKIHAIAEELEGAEGYRARFAGFSDATLSSVFCRTDLGAWSREESGEIVNEEAWLKGAYVCAGMSCKACKGRPLVEAGKQVWNYEQGPLWEACKLLTELNEEAEPEEEEPEGECPLVGGPKPCPRDHVERKEEEPCEEDGGERRKETNFERWLKSSGGRLRLRAFSLGLHVAFCILYFL